MNLIPPSTGNPDLDVFLYQIAQSLSGVQQSSSTPVPGGYSPSGNLVQYPLRYIHVKFADDNIGTGITNNPAGKLYFGLFNSSSSTESVNPADYTWVLVSGGGMGTTKNFWYRTIGGAYLDYAIASASPGNLFTIDTGGAIDLNINVTAEDTIGRVAFAKAATQQLASAPYNVATLGSVTFPATGTWGFAEVWQGSPPVVTGNEILFQLDGVYNASTNTTVWSSPYLAAFKVGQLSAIQANLGAITAGAAAIGSSPAISGTTMTGSGLFIGAAGQTAIGNAANNFVFDGANAYLNGFAATSAQSSSNTLVYSGANVSSFNDDSYDDGLYVTVTLDKPVFLLQIGVRLGLKTTAASPRISAANIIPRVRRNISGTWTLVPQDNDQSITSQTPLPYNSALEEPWNLGGTSLVTISPGSFVAGVPYRISIDYLVNLKNPDGGALVAEIAEVYLNTTFKALQYRI